MLKFTQFFNFYRAFKGFGPFEAHFLTNIFLVEKDEYQTQQLGRQNLFKVTSNYSGVEFILLFFFSLFKDIQQINVKFLLLTLQVFVIRIVSRIPAGNYMFKVNNRNTNTRCEICSKLKIKTLERRERRRSGAFIVDLENISHLVLVSLLLTFRR